MSFGLTDSEKLLQELGITEPEEIDLEAIAWHVGAKIKRRQLDGCEARILGTDNRAIITVNSNSAPVRQQFSIGHELGHWHYHRGKTLVCRKEDIGGRDNDCKTLEKQADIFASNLLLPNYILQPYLTRFKKLNVDTIRATAKTFNASIPATAIALVERGLWPALLVCHGQAGRKWFVRNASVQNYWFPSIELHPESNAIGILYGKYPDQVAPKKLSARIWFNCKEAYSHDVYEQSISTMESDVLSLLVF